MDLCMSYTEFIGTYNGSCDSKLFLDGLSCTTTKIIDLFHFSWTDLSFLGFLEFYMLNANGEVGIPSGAKDHIWKRKI